MSDIPEMLRSMVEDMGPSNHIIRCKLRAAADAFEARVERIKELEEAFNESDAACADLEDRIKELEEGSCRYNCRRAKDAFMAGFDAGALDTVDGGKIICEDYKREVTEKAYKEWRE